MTVKYMGKIPLAMKMNLGLELGLGLGLGLGLHGVLAKN